MSATLGTKPLNPPYCPKYCFQLDKLVLEKEEKMNDGSRARQRPTFLRCRPLEVRNGQARPTDSIGRDMEIGLGAKLDDDKLVETDNR